jgi:hypothetical protein
MSATANYYSWPNISAKTMLIQTQTQSLVKDGLFECNLWKKIIFKETIWIFVKERKQSYSHVGRSLVTDALAWRVQ